MVDQKKTPFSASQFLTISEPKLQNMRQISPLNFSLRNLFAIDKYTDGYRDLQTE